MNSSDSVDDSQPEELENSTLSWELITKKKDESTRKAKQLDKLYKSLKPLNNEFKDIPRIRSRNSTFQQNNQFTVVAAEFLNLSSKKELNQLFEKGFTKDQIEAMLENKYQEKKEFYTELNIKNHKFKRKNFESWRTMSNSHSATTNTFTSEEELFNQMTKSEQLRLKRINNKPLKKFQSTVNPNNRMSKSESADKSEALSTPSLYNIPKENGLLEISSDQNSSLIILNDVKRFERNDFSDSVSKEQNEETPKNIASSPKNIASSPKNVASSPIANKSTISIFDNTYMDAIIGEPKFHSSQNSNGELDNNQPFAEIDNSHITSDAVTKVSNSIPDLDVPENPQSDGVELSLSSKKDENTIIEEPIINDISIVEISTNSRRNLRHRTILNRNPYLVDRAEYLGLSTKYELISMEEGGKSDDDILCFLDEKYQKKRNERKEKDVGYGPYSKNTFFDIMNDINKGNKNTNFSEIGAFDTQTRDNDVSDEEFEFSMDEEEDDENDENNENEQDTQEYDSMKIQNDCVEDSFQWNGYNTGNSKSKKTSKTHESSKEDDSDTIDSMLQSRNRTSSGTKKQDIPKKINHLILSSKPLKIKNDHLLKSLKRTQSDISSDKSKRSKGNEVLEISNNHEFNPYSTDFLTLSDNESQNTTSKSYSSNNSRRKTVRNTHVIDDDENTKPVNLTGEARETNTYLSNHNLSVLNSNFKLSIGKDKDSRKVNLKKRNNNDDRTQNVLQVKKKKIDIKNIIAGSFAPVNNPNFVFNRDPVIESYQEETIGPTFIKNQHLTTVSDFNIDFAKNTLTNVKSNNTKQSDNKNVVELNINLSNIERLWNKYSDMKNIDDRRYKFILNLKAGDYKTLKIPESFIGSPLFKKTVDINEYFYREKNVKIEFLQTSLEYEVPLNMDSTFSKIQAFLDILLGAIRIGSLKKSQIKQLRKSLIHLVMIISNMKIDCPELLLKVGLEINAFFNKFKKIDHIDEILFCVFAPYFLLYMKMLQKYLPVSCEFLSSFQKTEEWLCRKIILHVCAVSFEKLFISNKKIALESLSLFLSCTNNPWSYLESALQSKNIDFLNVTNFLYFCNSFQPVEMDWEYFTTSLVKYSDSNGTQADTFTTIRNIFASILKINRELNWDIENQLLVKMFRLLAEFKFDNIGCPLSPKASIYPNVPATSALTDEDGCLDIYFKVLDIFSKQYFSENAKQIIERLIPVRSTFGYNPVQLQNRAKVLLMLVYMFDQDLMAGLEIILNDMIRNGSIYAVRSALALIRAIIKQTPRKPYSLVRKYVPSLIFKINHLPGEREVLSIFKDLIINVNEILNGQDISYLKRMVDFFSIILKLKNLNTHMSIGGEIDKSFDLIVEQYEFAEIIEISPKDTLRLKKSCEEIATAVKARLLDISSNYLDMKKQYLKYWLFFNSKLKKPAAQLFYTEWSYLGDSDFRSKLELEFVEYLIKWFDITKVKEDILIIYFRDLPILHLNLSKILNGLMLKNILSINMPTNQEFNKNTFETNRFKITIRSLSALMRQKDKKLKYNVLREFIKALKIQLTNFSAKEYVKEVGLYLYSIWDESFEIPEWDYLVSELKLQTVGESISRKIQFVETVDDIAVILEKNYINSIATKDYAKFIEQFKTFSTKSKSFDDNVYALCCIISFHMKSILNSNLNHWFHLLNWLESLEMYLFSQKAKLNVFEILKILYNLGHLHKMFGVSHDYRFYYYKVVYKVYQFLEWCANMFVGFDDMVIFIENFWSFAGMDPIITHNPASDIHSFPGFELEKKLNFLFNSSADILANKTHIPNTEKDVYNVEEDIKMLRNSMIKKWKLSNGA